MSVIKSECTAKHENLCSRHALFRASLICRDNPKINREGSYRAAFQRIAQANLLVRPSSLQVQKSRAEVHVDTKLLVVEQVG